MSALSQRSIAEGIHEVLKGKSPAEQKELLPSVVNFLWKKRLLGKSEDILARLESIVDKEEGRVTVKVSSSKPLHEEVKKKIRHELKERYGREAVLKEKTDEKLLGGFRVEIGDEVIDLTLRNKMNKLQEHLTGF